MRSNANTVRLMDGAEVRQMIGYAAACAKHADVNPPATPNEEKVGARYGLWLQKNEANAGKVLRDLQSNLGIGIAMAARSNYSNCEGVLREMIGFHDYLDSWWDDEFI